MDQKAAANSRADAPPVAAKHATAPTAASATTGAHTAHGHDVADVRAVGLEFPYPGYLANLVRQVRLRFAPTDARAGLHADLAFVVARDGSITGLRVVRGSGSYAFDLEAQGAVEAAGSARAFGPLPDGFTSASLPVTFSFDPRGTP
ncbi:MAG TPA: TonB family protein [Gemmatirosa sp.]